MAGKYTSKTTRINPKTGKKETVVKKTGYAARQEYANANLKALEAENKERKENRESSKNKNKYDLQSEGQKEMQGILDEALKMGTGPLTDVYGSFNEGEFNKGIVDPAMKNFREKILPQISEKFIAGGQAGGSGQLAAELEGGTDLASSLAGLNYGARQQQKLNRAGGVNTTLGIQPHENIIKQKAPKTNWLETGVKIGGNALAAYAGVPIPAGDIAVEGIKAGGINNR